MIADPITPPLAEVSCTLAPAIGPRAGSSDAPTRPELTSSFEPPGNDAERNLVAIWAELTGIDQFDAALRIPNMVLTTLNLQVPLIDRFIPTDPAKLPDLDNQEFKL